MAHKKGGGSSRERARLQSEVPRREGVRRRGRDGPARSSCGSGGRRSTRGRVSAAAETTRSSPEPTGTVRFYKSRGRTYVDRRHRLAPPSGVRRRRILEVMRSHASLTVRMSFVDHVRIRCEAGDGGRGAIVLPPREVRPQGRSERRRRWATVARSSLVADTDARKPRALRPAARARSDARRQRRRQHTATVPTVTTSCSPVPVGHGRARRGHRRGAGRSREAGGAVRRRARRAGRSRQRVAQESTHDRVPNYAEQGEPGDERRAHPRAASRRRRRPRRPAERGEVDAARRDLARDIRRSATTRSRRSSRASASSSVDESDSSSPTFPGLIEGASQGKGLGLRFLRHAERCAVLAVVVDLAAADPVGDLTAVVGEVEAYDAELASRVRVVVGNKIDLEAPTSTERSVGRRSAAATFVAISAAQGSQPRRARSRCSPRRSRGAKAERGEPESFAVLPSGGRRPRSLVVARGRRVSASAATASSDSSRRRRSTTRARSGDCSEAARARCRGGVAPRRRDARETRCASGASRSSTDRRTTLDA